MSFISAAAQLADGSTAHRQVSTCTRGERTRRGHELKMSYCLIPSTDRTNPEIMCRTEPKSAAEGMKGRC